MAPKSHDTMGQLLVDHRSTLAPTLFHRFQADDAIQAFQGSLRGFVGVFALVHKVLVAQGLCQAKRNECRNGCIGVNHSMENPYIHTSNHIIRLWIIFTYLIILPYSLWIWILDSSTIYTMNTPPYPIKPLNHICHHSCRISQLIAMEFPWLHPFTIPAAPPPKKPECSYPIKSI